MFGLTGELIRFEPNDSGWRFERLDSPLTLSDYKRWFDIDTASSIVDINVPYWAFAVPGIAAGAWGYRSLRQLRAAATACVNCRYDRTGLPDAAPCPECGRNE
ncbi:MAG: hypothetical protein H7Y88_02035 [Phycisphaerales bacterium]|nr:hypothetical protein [Phycisphaerales bacterium]